MPRIDFIAPIIRAALDTLEEQFGDHVDVFNAEDANEVELVEPVSYVFGAQAEMVDYPCVEVAVQSGTMGPFSLGEVGVGDADSTPRLTVVVWLMGETGEIPTLYEQALGYVRCVIEILAEKRALGDNADIAGQRDDAISWRVDVIPADPAQENRELQKWRVPALVTFVVEAVERWEDIP